MMLRLGFFIMVLLYLELEFDGVRSVPLQHCRGVKSPILSNETISSSTTHCIGIRRFDFITLNKTSTVCNRTKSNETLPFPSMLSFPDHQHQCRLNDTATIDKVFAAMSCQQKADINNMQFQCLFDVFIFEIDWVPLIGENTTETLFKMTSLCETKNISGLNRISISNDNYENNITIVAKEINCVCQITLNNTTSLVLHTYDNRLIRKQQMSLLYQNGSSVKTWTNMSDMSHIIETETITIAPQTLLLQWNNSAENDGGHFWISIEAVNSSMGFNSGTNRTTGSTQSGTTIPSIEPTTVNINNATTSTISSIEPTTDNNNTATTSTISSIEPTTDNNNTATSSTISSIERTTDNINNATASTISSIEPTTDNNNTATTSTIASIEPTTDNNNTATTSTISSIEPTTDNNNTATTSTISSIEPTTDNINAATTSTKATNTQDVTLTVTNKSVIVTNGSATGRSSSTTPKTVYESKDTNDNMGLIIGIVVGIFLLILMILVVCCVRWYFMKRNRTEPEKDDANRVNGAEKQNPEAHNTDVDDVSTKSGNKGLLPPITKDFMSNPVNARFSNVSRKNNTKTVEDFQQKQVDDAEYEHKGMEPEMETRDETADQTHPEKKKKKKKKKKRKRRIEETLDYLLEGDEQNNTTPIED